MYKTLGWLLIAASAFLATIGVAMIIMFVSEFGGFPPFALVMIAFGIGGIIVGVRLRNRQK